MAEENKEKVSETEQEKQETPAGETDNKDSETKHDENSSQDQPKEPVNKTAELEKQVADLTAQVALLKNAYAKAYADTENTKKRLQKEFDGQMKYTVQGIALKILPVVDDCERALTQATKDEAYRKGVEMIYGKLKSALESEGIVEIDCANKPFDANWHQAVMSEHVDGVEPGMVVEVLQKGYKLKDRLLRAAMVKVSE